MIFQLLISLLLCLGTFAVAAPPVHRIASIEEDGSKIRLDNGFTWEVFTFPLSWSDPREIVKQWEPGDEITIGKNKDPFTQYGHYYVSFYIKNLRTSTKASVKYGTQSSEWNAHRIEKIDPKGVITLSDGSRWNSWSTYVTNNWKIGERVIVYPYRRYINQYVLVNPDFGLEPMDSSWFRMKESNYNLSAFHATLLE